MTIQKTAIVAQTLPPLRICVDETELSRRPIDSVDPLHRTTLERLRSRLLQVDAFLATGQTEKALTIAKQVRSKATKSGLTAIAVEARLQSSLAEEQQGNYVEARKILETTFFEADISGNDLTALQAATKLIYSVGYRSAQYKTGKNWYLLATAKAQRLKLPENHLTVAEYAQNMASTYYIREKAQGHDHQDLAFILVELGYMLLTKKSFTEAQEPLERAVDICGKKPCETEIHGQAMFSLARALVATKGDTRRAIELAKKAKKEFAKMPHLKKMLKTVNTWLNKQAK